MGEGEGGGGQNKDPLVPPPLHPLPPREGRLLGGIKKMLEENCHIQPCLRGRLKPPLPNRGVEWVDFVWLLDHWRLFGICLPAGRQGIDYWNYSKKF
jgi:hypothetical protein